MNLYWVAMTPWPPGSYAPVSLVITSSFNIFVILENEKIENIF